MNKSTKTNKLMGLVSLVLSVVLAVVIGCSNQVTRDYSLESQKKNTPLLCEDCLSNSECGKCFYGEIHFLKGKNISYYELEHFNKMFEIALKGNKDHLIIEMIEKKLGDKGNSVVYESALQYLRDYWYLVKQAKLEATELLFSTALLIEGYYGSGTPPPTAFGTDLIIIGGNILLVIVDERVFVFRLQ